MAKPTIKFVFRENPDGSRTAIDSADFFGCNCSLTKEWDTEEHERFFEERVAIEEGKATYLCGGCKRPVVMRGGRYDGPILHFRHKHAAPSDCPFEEEIGPSQDEIRRMKYYGVQESQLHEDLKFFVANVMENDGNAVEVEKSVRNDISVRRRPDVLAFNSNKGIHIVFEIQMSTTFVNVVVGRMKDYKALGYHVLWIFHEFTPKLYTTKDTYQYQNNNVFVLDEEMKKLSLSRNKLWLKAHYLKYSYNYDNGGIDSTWRNDIVAIDDLTFDLEKGVYCFDSKGSREQAQQEKKRVEREAMALETALEKLYDGGCLSDFETDVLCEETGQKLDNVIFTALNNRLERIQRLYNYRLPAIIFDEAFKWLKIAKKRNFSKLYADISSAISTGFNNSEQSGNTPNSCWEGFKILDYPELISEKRFLHAIYSMGYLSSPEEVATIRKNTEELYKETIKDQKTAVKFNVALVLLYCHKIACSADNLLQRRKLLDTFFSNIGFIYDVASIVMRRHIGHLYNSYTSFCNHVWDKHSNLIATFFNVIEKSGIERSQLKTAKTDHYARLRKRAEEQPVDPDMSALLSILFPKIWDI